LSVFSEGGQACLPNPDYGEAGVDWHQCFWLNWLYPVRVKSLQPDITVPLKFEDWNCGRAAADVVASELAERPRASRLMQSR
jgi:hypothetical protein